MRHTLYIVPIILLLWYLDNIVSKDRTIGWERNSVFDAQKRWQSANGREAILLGSSTSVDWFRPEYVEQIFHLPKGSVVDAHVNGCHQGCSFAQVRKIISEKRHYRRAFYGTNQFQLCEFDHSKRTLQQQMMIPTEDIPQLFSIYTQAEAPLNYMARFFGITLSGVYSDTSFLQQQWAKTCFGDLNRGREHFWYTEKLAQNKSKPWCSYEPEKIAYKKAFSKALIKDMCSIADTVYLMLLPDENLSKKDPAIAQAWAKHRNLHKELAGNHKQVVLIDLTQGQGAKDPNHFRDGFHVSGIGANLQRALFEKILRERGEIQQ